MAVTKNLKTKYLLAITFVIFFVIIYKYWQFKPDDAFIVMRYAENLVDQGKLVFNNGEFINANTSPLLVLLESLLYILTGHILLSYKILSVFLVFFSIIILNKLFKDDHESNIVIVSFLLISPCILLWTLGGLGTPLALFFSTIVSVASFKMVHKPNDHLLFFICFLSGILFVTRYDTSVFTFPITLHSLLLSKRVKSCILALLTGAIVPISWLLFSFFYYGDIFPTSFYVKSPEIAIGIMLKNASYIFQYLVFTGFIPFLLFLFFYSKPKSTLLKILFGRFKKFWGLYFGLLSVLVYGLTMATTHMMYSFRFFVPFIPVLLIIMIDIYIHLRTTLSPVKRTGEYLFWSFIVILMFFQVFQAVYTYKYSVNGLSRVGELQKTGLVDSDWSCLKKVSNDIKKHWEGLPESRKRVPKILTFGEGILPYSYKTAYIFGTLISYRRQQRPAFYQNHAFYNFEYRLKRDFERKLKFPVNGILLFYIYYIPYADYYIMLIPKDLGKSNIIDVGGTKLIASYKIKYEGKPLRLAVYYNATPQKMELPKYVDGKYPSISNSI